jgi:hypothetical protein
MPTVVGEHPTFCHRNSFPKELNKNRDDIEESFGYAVAIPMNISRGVLSFFLSFFLFFFFSLFL